MQTLQNANGTFLHLLQSFAALMSERPDDAELDDKGANQCDEELRSLQSVQKALERRISFVSRRRNTFPQINNLPRELLVDIFTLSLDNDCGIVFSNHATLSLVCQYWNHIVDTTPSLWTRIDGGTMSATKIIRALENSRDAPLDITFPAWSLGRPERGAFLDSMSRHAHRWREVSLSLEDVDQDLGGFPTSSMPLLEYLHIWRDPHYSWVHPEPLDLFGGRSPPRLRKLYLGGIPVPWSPTILCHLTMLTISHIRDLGPSLDQLIAVLSACPDLESLSISEVSFSGEASASSSHPIHLPALAKLALRALPTDITSILASIHAPNCVSGELYCNVLGDPLQTLLTSNVSHFFDHIRSNPGAGSITCHSGLFNINRMGSWNITLSVDNITFAKDTLTWLSSSSIQMGMDGLSTPLADVLAAVADMGALYRIDFGYDAQVSDALTLLATCGPVQISTLSGWPLPGLVEISFASAFAGDDWERFLLMLRRRQGAPETQSGAQHPKPLRKFEFGRGHWYPGADNPVIANFGSTYWPNCLDEVRRLLGPEGELMWYGRAVTEEGVLEDRIAYQN